MRNIAKSAPESPGVYIMRDSDGCIIYVGKARVLRNRLSSYFSGTKDIKTRHLVARVGAIEWILTGTEYEALLLENTLIKKHSPKYNINLKDGKTYPAIRITNEEFPRVFRTRRVINDGSRYFGPFPSVDIIDLYLDLVRRLFPLRRCKKLRKRDTPCMYFHIGRCAAPCAGKVSREDYAIQVERVAQLLGGESDGLIASLRDEMEAASAGLRFEKAAELRDSIAAIESFRSENRVVDFDATDRDYIAWEFDGTLVTFVAFQMRGGKLTGRDLFRERFFGTEEEAATGFLAAYYVPERLPPPMVYVRNAEGLDVTREYFVRALGSAARIEPPAEKRHEAAMAMAVHNAREDIGKRRREIGDLEALESLRVALDLPAVPERIEGFDIAQLSGKHTVASLVSFLNGVPDKRNYRIFKIRSLDGRIDDFGAVREVVARRYTRLMNEDAEMPDLILIDGGIGQVNAAKEILDALGADTPVVGLAKENEELWLPGAKEPIVLPKDSAGIRVLVAVRDETHRFATGMNQRLRSKAVSFPVLEAVSGVGPGRAKRLMESFGSLRAIAEAEPEYIAKTARLPAQVAEEVRKAAATAADAPAPK